MEQKRPILIWRLKDAPPDVIKGDAFFDDDEGYRQWRSGKRGDEFVVLIPEGYFFDDVDIAYELGLNVTEAMRSLTFGEPPNPNCEAFSHINHEWVSYTAYVIPTFAGQRESTQEKVGGEQG
jgi:hypothetical protein